MHEYKAGPKTPWITPEDDREIYHGVDGNVGSIITAFLDPLPADEKEEVDTYQYDAKLTLFANLSAQIARDAGRIARKIDAGNLDAALADMRRMPVGREKNDAILHPVFGDKGTLVEILAREAALRAAAGEIDAMLAIIDVVPAVHNRVCKVQVPTSKKWVKQKLLGILAMLGDVNFYTGFKEYGGRGINEYSGGVERLKNLLAAKGVSDEEMRGQILEAMPAHWRSITATRMAPYWQAVERLKEAFSEAKEEEVGAICSLVLDGKLNRADIINTDRLMSSFLMSHIRAFWKKMLPDVDSADNEVVTQGWVFDPSMLVKVRDDCQQWINTFFGGVDSDKYFLFSMIVIGCFQANLSPCDRQVLTQGLLGPHFSLSFLLPDGRNFIRGPLSLEGNLGIDCVLDEISGRLMSGRMYDYSGIFTMDFHRIHQLLLLTKSKEEELNRLAERVPDSKRFVFLDFLTLTSGILTLGTGITMIAMGGGWLFLILGLALAGAGFAILTPLARHGFFSTASNRMPAAQGEEIRFSPSIG